VARTTLSTIVARLELAFPDLHRTDDVHGRISDVTYDVGEHQRVPQATIDAVIKLATELGAYTMVSSVHLHLSLDRHDKATGSLSVLRDHFGWDTTLARVRFAFIGDSGNDAACFAAFHTSIAVANLTGRPTLLPRYVTRAPRAAGFVETARLLLTSDNPELKRGFSSRAAKK
jgi:hydroxymethylpyrimidine pyrophosphatase-like HAD family hydrolase